MPYGIPLPQYPSHKIWRRMILNCGGVALVLQDYGVMPEEIGLRYTQEQVWK